MNQSLTAGLRRHRLPLLLALVQWLASFGLERLVFTVPPTAHLFDYLLCKLLLFAVMFAFWRFLCHARRGGWERSVLLHALPYLAVLIVWLLLYHPFVLTADELNIYQHAVQLDSFSYWFNYLTGYYWIMGLMVIPHPMGPVFLKLLLQALIVGYVVARQTRLSGKWGWLLYLPFCFPFVLEQGISAHRLPVYGMLYLFLMAKLVYDRREDRRPDRRTLAGLSLLIGVLVIWRTEGIYLAPLGAVLLCVAYRVKVNRAAWKKLPVYVLLLAVVALPQLKGYFVDSDLSLGLRTKPLCGYALCNMFRNGLTEDMIAEERADIEGYLDLQTIRDYNARNGDLNYSSALIMDGAKEADYAAQERFCDAVKRVILKHPLIYLKSQWNAWRYTSDQYGADFSGGLPGLFHGLYALSCKVWIPTALVALFCLIALVRRNWLVFWLTGCGLANWVIVTVFMPAAYAKYFYVDYLMGYFLLFAGLCCLLARWRRRHAVVSE